jgi:hypothetical protein
MEWTETSQGLKSLMESRTEGVAPCTARKVDGRQNIE